MLSRLLLSRSAPCSQKMSDDESTMPLSGPERVRQFLMGGVSKSAQEKYRAALKILEDHCAAEDLDFHRMSEQQQGWVVAELVLDAYENDEPRHS